MNAHMTVHKLKFIAQNLIEAKAYTTSSYAHDHLDNAIEACEGMIDIYGEKLIQDGVEKC
jgi:hypothetical protein